jgi:hypothetical protein
MLLGIIAAGKMPLKKTAVVHLKGISTQQSLNLLSSKEGTLEELL